MKNEKANVNRLIGIYKALCGLCSETYDPFDHFHPGGTDALMSDMERVLTDCGVEVVKNSDYFIAPYMDKGKEKWGICFNPECPKGSWVLTGFNTSEDACRSLMDKSVFPDFCGKPRILDMCLANGGKASTRKGK